VQNRDIQRGSKQDEGLRSGARPVPAPVDPVRSQA
jgi:hypothetical protein